MRDLVFRLFDGLGEEVHVVYGEVNSSNLSTLGTSIYLTSQKDPSEFVIPLGQYNFADAQRALIKRAEENYELNGEYSLSIEISKK